MYFMTLRQGYLLSLESFIDVINKKEKTQITKFTNGLECYDPLELRIEFFFIIPDQYQRVKLDNRTDVYMSY